MRVSDLFNNIFEINIPKQYTKLINKKTNIVVIWINCFTLFLNPQIHI